MQSKRNIVAIVIIVLAIVGVVYYKYFSGTIKSNVPTQSTEVARELDLTVSKEIDAVATYAIPNGEDKVRFTLSLNKDGQVIGVKTTDVLKNEAISTKQAEFSNNLLMVIKGKKLSEISALDRIGTSSLTTAAFNNALGELKSKI